MITEFGGGNNEGCFQAISNLFQYIADNDVYIGWAIWAAGPSKPFSCAKPFMNAVLMI
jgi:endoglucanase